MALREWGQGQNQSRIGGVRHGHGRKGIFKTCFRPVERVGQGGKVICGTYVARKLHDEHAACAGLVALGEVFWLYMNMNGGAA